MQTPTTLKNHPLHPMLIALPIGFLIFSIIGDVFWRLSGDLSWATLAMRALGAGVIAGLVAAVPGLIDWTTLDGRAHRVGLFHMGANVCALVLFALSFWLRWKGALTDGLPFGLSLAGLALLGLGGFLGGTLVYEERVAVQEDRGSVR